MQIFKRKRKWQADRTDLHSFILSWREKQKNKNGGKTERIWNAFHDLIESKVRYAFFCHITKRKPTWLSCVALDLDRSPGSRNLPCFLLLLDWFDACSFDFFCIRFWFFRRPRKNRGRWLKWWIIQIPSQMLTRELVSCSALLLHRANDVINRFSQWPPNWSSSVPSSVLCMFTSCFPSYMHFTV